MWRSVRDRHGGVYRWRRDASPSSPPTRPARHGSQPEAILIDPDSILRRNWEHRDRFSVRPETSRLSSAREVETWIHSLL